MMPSRDSFKPRPPPPFVDDDEVDDEDKEEEEEEDNDSSLSVVDARSSPAEGRHFFSTPSPSDIFGIASFVSSLFSSSSSFPFFALLLFFPFLFLFPPPPSRPVAAISFAILAISSSSISFRYAGHVRSCSAAIWKVGKVATRQ